MLENRCVAYCSVNINRDDQCPLTFQLQVVKDAEDITNPTGTFFCLGGQEKCAHGYILHRKSRVVIGTLNLKLQHRLRLAVWCVHTLTSNFFRERLA